MIIIAILSVAPWFPACLLVLWLMPNKATEELGCCHESWAWNKSKWKCLQPSILQLPCPSHPLLYFRSKGHVTSSQQICSQSIIAGARNYWRIGRATVQNCLQSHEAVVANGMVAGNQGVSLVNMSCIIWGALRLTDQLQIPFSVFILRWWTKRESDISWFCCCLQFGSQVVSGFHFPLFTPIPLVHVPNSFKPDEPAQGSEVHCTGVRVVEPGL